MRAIIERPKRNGNDLVISSFLEDFFPFPSVFAKNDMSFSPRVDIQETEDQLTIAFELPGMDKNDVKIVVRDNVLSVSGSREVKNEDSGIHYIRSEIASGSFCRQFTLPDTVEPDSISAEYKNGLLEVKLNKREEAKPKEIEIKVA